MDLIVGSLRVRRCAVVDHDRTTTDFAYHAGLTVTAPLQVPVPIRTSQRGYAASVLLVLVVIAVAVGWTWLALTWTYSEGERVGFVQKLSKKGWVCKTWEGELNMVVLPGSIPDKFNFTVREDGIADQINRLAGKQVRLDYQEHRFIPTTCFGDTEYFVTGVKLLE
jgi:hypothetical protein